MLASASPRRVELLRLAGLEPAVRPVDVDETRLPGEDPATYVRRLAVQKARAAPVDGSVVLAADTAVVVDGDVLGKPADADDARTMLRRLSGCAHRVSSGVAVRGVGGDVSTLVVTTEVVMTTLSDAAIAAYVATGEPLDKAGGYGIQGRAAAFVERLDGSWTNVVGLPLVESLRLLRAAGVAAP